MKAMNRRSILLFATLVAAASYGAHAQELSAVRTVYLLPMGSGLDQYLANQITTQGVFKVVTEPERADAVLTGEIGPGFEQQLEELYPPPPAEEPAAGAESSAEQAQLVIEDSGRPTASSFARGKGNVFLVGLQSRQVIWSIYQLPKNSTSKQLNDTAKKIVGELRKTLGR